MVRACCQVLLFAWCERLVRLLHDTGNNLTNLSHQANSNTWQQALTIHPNNNHGTETQQSTSDFDANGNLLTLKFNPVNHKFSIPLIYSVLHTA
jgi:hypothetical protein